jgi:formyltetrahydrofolate-dependent phosphoribosylglycinamide formyltransferase
MIRLAVFVSGRGSNLQAIIRAGSEGLINIDLRAVLTNKSDCGAIEIAQKNNIPVYIVSEASKPGYLSYEEITGMLKAEQIDLIVLAGYLKKIPEKLVDEFQDRIINIHPALLPSFGGAGMYGMNVHRAVFNSSAKVSGATVHFVDKIYDNGKIIAQKAVDISDVQTPEEIAERVLKVEHEILPFVIKKISEGKVIIENNRVTLLT